MTDIVARRRYLIMTVTRIAAAGGAVLGVILLAKAPHWPQRVLGGAIVLASLYMMAVVPLALAHRWRTPPGE